MLYQPPIMWDNEYYISFFSGKFIDHWHKEIEILFCTEGSVTYEVDKKIYVIYPNEVLIINSLEEHSLIYATPQAKNLIIEIGYGLLGNEFNEIVNRRFINPIIKFENGEVNEIVSIFNKIITEYEINKTGFDNKWIMKGYLFELAALLWRYVPMADDISDKRQKKLKHIMTIQRVLDYVDEFYYKKITIDDAADMINYENKSFCRKFKSITGVTFHKYLNMYRINQACRMIEYGQHRFNEISEKCGFNHPKSFCRLFKNNKGMTPTEYKYQINNN